MEWNDLTRGRVYVAVGVPSIAPHPHPDSAGLEPGKTTRKLREFSVLFGGQHSQPSLFLFKFDGERPLIL